MRVFPKLISARKRGGGAPLLGLAKSIYYNYDNGYKTKENKNCTKDKIELQHTYACFLKESSWYLLKGACCCL